MFEVLYKNIYVNLDENHKLNINLGLIIIILTINGYYAYQRFVTKKNDEKFIKFYKDLYYDFLRFLFIEFGIIISELIDSNKFNITRSLGRIAFVHIALVLFHNSKWVLEDIT
jgi:hypothetical protein